MKAASCVEDGGIRSLEFAEKWQGSECLDWSEHTQDHHKLDEVDHMMQVEGLATCGGAPFRQLWRPGVMNMLLPMHLKDYCKWKSTCQSQKSISKQP